MATILKREFAPISDTAWNQLDAEAARVIRANLAGRRVVDVAGPHGWEFAAVNTGRLHLGDHKAAEGIPWGARIVLPLVEARNGFKLAQMELDDYDRGAKDVDIDPLLEAAAKVAHFEDRAVFNGFSEAGITGLLQALAHDPVNLPADGANFPAVVGQAVKVLALAGIGGPYALVLGPEPYFHLYGTAIRHGYPAYRAIGDILQGGEIVRCPVIDSGLVLSTRGGDFELTLGQDFSLGYANHDRDSVELFITESFTFRVLEPRAAVALNPA